jgi:signal transduction histidine kinase
MSDLAHARADGVDAVSRLDAVPTLLRVVCDATGLGLAVVARVSATRWTACAVLDRSGFGLRVGDELELSTTLGREVRESRTPIAIDHARTDPRYADHPTPLRYGFQSYVSVPIVLPDGSCFGNLCALGREPAQVSDPRTLGMFTAFAQLIGVQLENERRSDSQRAALHDERSTAELREQFIAVLGHDLRNPLNVVATNTQLLAAVARDAPTREIARRIDRSVRRMSGLIDDVLDFARGRLGGGFDVQLTDVHDVGQALHEVVDEARCMHPGRHVEVSIEAPRAVRCDRARIQQLAANLLSNALKHGAPQAPVQFSAAVSQDAIVVTVRNQGEPIPTEDLRQVFQPFWRQAGSRREGLGLGLFICAEIARAHHGRIEVMSSRDHGTTFAAHLPVGPARQSIDPPR